MTTLIIPTGEIREGDIVTLSLVVDLASTQPTETQKGVHRAIYGTICGREQALYLPEGVDVTVERPDPDADLIQRLIDVITSADSSADAARDCLAVVRAEQ